MKKSFFITLIPLTAILFILLGCEKNECIEPSISTPIAEPKPIIEPTTPIITQKTSVTETILVNTGTTEDLLDIIFTNSSTGFICGDNGLILKTTDGGETWVQKNTGSNAYLRRIAFINESIGFAVGNFSTILKTTDGGETWTRKYHNPAIIYPKHLRTLSISNNNIFTGGSWGAFLTSNDQGETWTDRNIDNSSTFYAQQFIDDNNGIIAGNFTRMFSTNNGGLSWTSIDPPAIHNSATTINYQTIIDFHFFDNSTGYLLTLDGFNFNYSKLLKTTDFGKNWTELSVPQYANTQNYDISFSSPTHGFIVTNGTANNIGVIIKTTDGGANWETFLEDNIDYNRVLMINDTTAFFLSNNGILKKGQ